MGYPKNIEEEENSSKKEELEKEIRRNNQIVKNMRQITQIRKLSLWIFLFL